MPHPGLALHEVQLAPHVGAVRRGEQPGQVGGVEDDLGDAEAARRGGSVQFEEVLGQRVKVDPVGPPAGVGIEVDVIAPLVADAGRQRDRAAVRVAYRHKEVDRQAVLVGAVRPEPATRGPAGFAVDVSDLGRASCQGCVGIGDDLGHLGVHMRAAQRDAEAAVGREIRTVDRQGYTVLKPASADRAVAGARDGEGGGAGESQPGQQRRDGCVAAHALTLDRRIIVRWGQTSPMRAGTAVFFRRSPPPCATVSPPQRGQMGVRWLMPVLPSTLWPPSPIQPWFSCGLKGAVSRQQPTQIQRVASFACSTVVSWWAACGSFTVPFWQSGTSRSATGHS
mmetsp:Transcript_37528/g.87547  ORF Transcript_37528/g.87547 Transcript_37528/m.87547 type:complete len:337 (+) Transcript_37528:1633-2643(+)